MGSLVGSPRPLLDLSWTFFWALLGPILSPPVPLLAYLGPPLAYLCSWWPSVTHWGPLSSFLGPLLGSFLDSFGPLLVPFWPSCSSFLAFQRALLGSLGLSWASQASSRVFSGLALLLLQSGSVRCSQVTLSSLQPIVANSCALIAIRFFYSQCIVLLRLIRATSQQVDIYT